MYEQQRGLPARQTRGKRNLEEYPNHILAMKAGKYDKEHLTFEQQVERQFLQAQEERPAAMRSIVVEKYVREILNKNKNPG